MNTPPGQQANKYCLLYVAYTEENNDKYARLYINLHCSGCKT